MEKLDVDRIAGLSLEQALLDFELANSRVLDLTGRLTSLTEEVFRLRTELENSRFALAGLQATNSELHVELDTIKRSLAYRLLRVLGDTRARLR